MWESEILHSRLTERIIGLFFQVYTELGFGFLEAVYEAAMEVALIDAGLRVVRQVAVPVMFRNRVIGEYFADLLVEDVVLLELKAVRAIDPKHEAQVLNYLRATRIEVGFVLNFGLKPEFKRLVFANDRKAGFGSECRPDPR